MGAAGSRSAGQSFDDRVGEGLGAEVAAQVAGLAVVVEGVVVGGLDTFGDVAAVLVLARIRQVVQQPSATSATAGFGAPTRASGMKGFAFSALFLATDYCE